MAQSTAVAYVSESDTSKPVWPFLLIVHRVKLAMEPVCRSMPFRLLSCQERECKEDQESGTPSSTDIHAQSEWRSHRAQFQEAKRACNPSGQLHKHALE